MTARPDRALRLRRLRDPHDARPTPRIRQGVAEARRRLCPWPTSAAAASSAPVAQAALKENRQRAFDDFIGVAEDLIRRKAHHAGAGHHGRQQRRAPGRRHLHPAARALPRGGLPGAAVGHAALHQDRAPAPSWIGEYGDPADPKMAEVIRRYSPYQNMKPGRQISGGLLPHLHQGRPRHARCTRARWRRRWRRRATT